MKEIVLPLVFGLLLTFLVCFFFRLMDFFQKKRLWAALNLIFQEKLDDEEVFDGISLNRQMNASHGRLISGW